MSADQYATRAFATAFTRFVRGFGLLDAERTPCGAPMPVAEAHALTVLAEAGPMSQKALGEHLHLAKSNTSRLVDSLVARGWAKRTADTTDGRVRLIALTEQGRSVAAGVAERRAARLAALLDRVPAEERGTVLRALHLLEESTRDR